jgi:chromatin segregation and condensation protein Rec8/ScpA/Scc1 (kleisin family)
MEVIVRFLGVLELCKQGRVTLDQGQTFGSLEVAWVTSEEPVRVGAGPVVEYDEYEG